RRSESKLHLVYFSYREDFEYLAISLRSLSRLSDVGIASLTIVEDVRLPFTDLMRSELTAIFPELNFSRLGKIDWASVDTLQTELTAFYEASLDAGPDDFIVKVDSDVLFLSSGLINLIRRSSFNFVGDGHYCDYQY
ncbi:unnamed protein product, partial [Ectocarpus sp. 12 AP-2014]